MTETVTMSFEELLDAYKDAHHHLVNELNDPKPCSKETAEAIHRNCVDARAAVVAECDEHLQGRADQTLKALGLQAELDSLQQRHASLREAVEGALGSLQHGHQGTHVGHAKRKLRAALEEGNR